MSEQTQPEEEALTIHGDVASSLTQIMDFLAPSSTGEETPATPEAGEAPAPQPGSSEDGAVAGGGEPAPDGTPASGDAGVGGVPDASGTDATAPADGGTGTVPGVGTVDASSLTDTWGEVATSFQNSQADFLQKQTLEEVQNEYKNYFDRLRVHPRTLVGEQVMAVNGKGMETLRDAEDARQWQEAIKQILASELESRVQSKQEELKDAYSTVHASIDLFRNNADLIPGTKQFDPELANEFVTMVKDFEVRSNDRLIGFSVPVQPIINQLRSKLVASRAAAAAPPSESPQQQRASEQARSQETGRWEAPQGGISSKAGSSVETNDDAAGVLSAIFRQNQMRF